MKHRVARHLTRIARGYTLIELMIVVAIVGILAAIAIPTFQGYLRRTRSSDAVTFLGAVKERQAAYFAEMGQGCDVDTPNPATMPTGGNTQDWSSAANWNTLGVTPDRPDVFFQYNTYAGAPGTTPAAHPSGDFDTARGYLGNDYWWISTAHGDLDGDGNISTFESYSGSATLYINEP